MDTIIDLELLDQNEENPFEIIAAYVERASLEGKIDEQTKDGLMKVALSTERKLQDLSEGGSKEAVVLNCAYEVARTISAVITVPGEVDEGMLTTIKSGFTSMNKSIDESEEMEVDQIRQKFKLLSPKAYLEAKHKYQVTVEELKKAINVSFTNFGIVYPNDLPIHGMRRLIGFKDPYDEWEFEFVFNTSYEDNHKPMEFIYQFIEIMNKIEGVQFYLEDIKIGSIKAKIKAIYDSAKSKDEVKELLESSRKFAKAKLEKDFDEQEKIRAEKDKITVEKELLQKQLQENTSIQADYKRALEIQNMEAELRKKQLENLQLELKVLKETKDAFAELLAEGYISQSEFELLIKGLPFLKVINGRLTMGESSDVIDDL